MLLEWAWWKGDAQLLQLVTEPTLSKNVLLYTVFQWPTSLALLETLGIHNLCETMIFRVMFLLLPTNGSVRLADYSTRPYESTQYAKRISDQVQFETTTWISRFRTSTVLTRRNACGERLGKALWAYVYVPKLAVRSTCTEASSWDVIRLVHVANWHTNFICNHL